MNPAFAVATARPVRSHVSSSSHVTLTHSRVFDPAAELDWQRLWLSTRPNTWSSLALVGVSDRVPTRVMARALAEVGRQHHGNHVTVIDGLHLELSDLEDQRNEVLQRVRRNETVLVALPCPLEHPAVASLVDTIDAVVLCLGLGQSSVGRAREVTRALASSKVIGAVLLGERPDH